MRWLNWGLALLMFVIIVSMVVDLIVDSMRESASQEEILWPTPCIDCGLSHVHAGSDWCLVALHRQRNEIMMHTVNLWLIESQALRGGVE